MVKYMVLLYVCGFLHDTKVVDTRKEANAIKETLSKINCYTVKIRKVVVE